MRQVNTKRCSGLSRSNLWLMTAVCTGDWLKGWVWLPMKLSVGMAAIALLTTSAQAATLTDWKFDPATRQLQVSIPEGTVPHYFLLAQPARIVLDLPNTQMGSVPSQQTYSGAVSQIRVGQFQDGLTRIVIELAPDAVLAPGQVELQPVGSDQGNSSDSRWILQPLFADRPVDRSAIAAQPDTAQPDTVQPDTAQPNITVPDITAPASGLPSESASSGLPALEPGAIVIPTAPAAAAVPAPAAVPVLENPTPLSVSSAPAVSENQADASVADATVSMPPSTVSPTMMPTLPSTVSQPAQPITVTVPPLQPSVPIASPASSGTALSPASPAVTSVAPSVEFGQPRPEPIGMAGAGVEIAASPNILVPAGTLLSLRYPRETALELKADRPLQEVLLLQQAVRDRNGNILLAEGSQVIGRFETSSSGSKFVAQAIALPGQNLRLNAESGSLAGDREVSGSNLAINSAIGAFALSVLSGSATVGLLGGATAGAATTYLTAPQPATIQPNQVIQIRLLVDLPRPGLQP
jgi:hypothetical protein